MSLYIKDPATSEAVRKLARLRGTTLTEAIRIAVLNALVAEGRKEEDARLAELHKRVKQYPDTGLKADKAYFDSLYED